MQDGKGLAKVFDMILFQEAPRSTSLLEMSDIWVQEGKGAAKDFDMSPFEAARKLLSGETERMSMSDRLELVFQDMDLVPLLIQVITEETILMIEPE